ncbi:beta-N-acetylhexosaminidase [Paraglaciecola aquimarina]|uniref:beta-N-acetylhexosaminidase n=1 Tax=Paraglaciecola algarum TaxID=3050085 RepID=A0ABS9D6U3_9ALTE|nr:beta-N-acetylhexosaminidase [Paraglaciecola sp. G1-23]MCF2947544.1 beta-N-acetylhexosaminidase [Paraglaciecola sp. G1-23]
MKILYLLFIVSFIVGCGTSDSHRAALDTELGTHEKAIVQDKQLPLIPYPQSITRHSGTLQLSQSVVLIAPQKASTAMPALIRVLDEINLKQDASSASKIHIQLVDEPILGAEGYRLIINNDIKLSANSDAGLFYGVQTLSQLLIKQQDSLFILPKVEITDTPTFAWRGNMLDVARSFLPVEYLKQHIERMARFKLNRLHLHLTDDQGWRVEIAGYPKLTEIGGASAVEGGRSGFYTQDQIRQLVKFAQDRHVTLVPEVDLPGHTQAAIAAYNRLACDDVTNLAPYNGLEVGFSKLCLTKPETTYPFVKDVLTQLVALFPSKYIHIGGDEIKDPLYAEFIGRATRMVEELGRTAIAWEEGSVADNNPDVLLQLWNDKYDIQPALARGHQIILSPCSYTYFDHGNYTGQANTYDWCRKEGVPLERAYQLNPQNFKQVIGVESAMWSELVHTNEAADNRLWPRLLATAELAWTEERHRDYPRFLSRVDSVIPILDRLNIKYYQD